jgi:hypothetical protein
MPTLEIGEELYDFLQRHASDTVAQVFGIRPQRSTNAVATQSRPRRQPKTDLFDLTRAGLLSRGQTLFLHDYQGKRLAGMQAELGPTNKLIWHGKRYSMSRLASLLLGKQGYSSDSVRGPAHWFTESGESVKAIWQRYQRDRRTPKSSAA